MDNIFLKPNELAARDHKEKQEAIFEISIGSLHYFKILSKMRCRFAPVFFNDPQATQTAFDFKKRSSIPLYSRS
jgi:hypothetical protein